MTDTVLITPEELSALAATGKAVIIDTRDPKSYAAGHIPGAVNLHEIFTYLATSTPEGMVELNKKFAAAFGSAGLGGAETAIIYEQSMSTGFGQSCRGYFLLKYLGYPSAKILHGGLSAWTAKGLPTSTVVPSPVARVFPIDPAADPTRVQLRRGTPTPEELALLDEVAETGEALIVTKRGKPVARVESVEPSRSLAGSVTFLVSDDELIAPLYPDYEPEFP